MKEISVVIVTYNSQPTIKKCLDSILQSDKNVEIIVFDNGSSDKTREVVGKFGRNLRLIKSPKNLGFAKANNLAVNKASGEVLIFLNPDTEIIQKGDLQRLKETLIENPKYGLIGPKIVFPDGSVQSTVRKLPTAFGAFKQYILKLSGSYDFYQPKCSELCSVESVTGACMVIKKDVFIKAGRFNEKYFMYFEDIELCKNIRKLKLKVGYLPSVAIEHILGASGKYKPTFSWSKISARKYHGFFNYVLIELILLPQRLSNKFKNAK